MSPKIFFSIAIGLISGLVLGIFIAPDQVQSLILISGLIILVWIIVCKKLFHEKKFLIIGFITLVALCIGYLRVQEFHRTYPFDSFNQYHNKTITVVGIIDQVPSFKPGTQQLIIQPIVINGEKVPEKTLKIGINVSDLESYSYNDQIVFSGKFMLRDNFESDTGRTVQYRLMSYSKKVIGDISYPTVIEHVHSEFSVWDFFSSVKQKFVKSLHQLFYSPASGLLAGIMIGDTSTLDNNLLDIFRMVGLIHIVVLSGYNITLVANFFVRMFAPLGYHRRLIAAMFALLFFIAIVGISQTALRAGIMALCAFASRYYIRPYIVLRGIILALLIMGILSPYALLFDLSLQLSFLATIGIVYMFPIMQEKFPRLSENFFGEILIQTVAVNILTLPIIIYQMGYFSLISFPINVLVLGIISLLTVSGFAAVFAGMVFFPLGQILALPIQVITDLIIKVSDWAAKHDPFQFHFQVFSVYWMISIYVIIFIWIIRHISSKKTQQ